MIIVRSLPTEIVYSILLDSFNKKQNVMFLSLHQYFFNSMSCCTNPNHPYFDTSEFVFLLDSYNVSFVFCLKTGTQPFNRAMLFNVGFKEAMKDAVWDCIIFHDVDHLPENDRNYYGCGEMPRHFAAKLDKYMYILPYNEFFGGVSGLTVEQFKKINGFPNAFWGWGGEDDDLWNRVHYAGYNVTRPEGDLGKYKSIPHHHRGEVQFLGRYKLLRYSRERQYIDGLNNLIYTPKILVSRLYKNITVNLIPELAPVRDY
uniref:glucosylceramide beta-1,4-galactosyltransferase n=1 Tax=Accipiter nisus TaxID=211598 RepID=A0A8B9MWD7_9AVES